MTIDKLPQKVSLNIGRGNINIRANFQSWNELQDFREWLHELDDLFPISEAPSSSSWTDSDEIPF